MSIAQIEKIYKNKDEIGKFSSLNRQISKEQNAVRWIFENVRLLSNFVSLSEKLNALEAVSGILNELTSKQMEIFEKAAKRRSLFK